MSSNSPRKPTRVEFTKWVEKAGALFRKYQGIKNARRFRAVSDPTRSRLRELLTLQM